MIKIIVHAFAETEKAVVEVLFASADEEAVLAKMIDFQKSYPEDYLAIYDLPLDCDLANLPHYPSVGIGKDDFK